MEHIESLAKLRRSKLNALLEQMKCLDEVYVSKHFAERMVERNADALDVCTMLVPLIKEFRVSTYCERSFLVKWKQFALVAKFTLFNEKRTIILKSIIDKYDENDFDVTVQI